MLIRNFARAVNLIWANLQQGSEWKCESAERGKQLKAIFNRSIDFVSNWTNCDLMKRDYNGDKIINIVCVCVCVNVVSLDKIWIKYMCWHERWKVWKKKKKLINRVEKFANTFLFRIRTRLQQRYKA